MEISTEKKSHLEIQSKKILIRILKMAYIKHLRLISFYVTHPIVEAAEKSWNIAVFFIFFVNPRFIF